MAKINSWSWVEKDDPMFTGRFKVHSVKKQESRQKIKKKDKINYARKTNIKRNA